MATPQEALCALERSIAKHGHAGLTKELEELLLSLGMEREDTSDPRPVP